MQVRRDPARSVDHTCELDGRTDAVRPSSTRTFCSSRVYSIPRVTGRRGSRAGDRSPPPSTAGDDVQGCAVDGVASPVGIGVVDASHEDAGGDDGGAFLPDGPSKRPGPWKAPGLDRVNESGGVDPRARRIAGSGETYAPAPAGQLEGPCFWSETSERGSVARCHLPERFLGQPRRPDPRVQGGAFASWQRRGRVSAHSPGLRHEDHPALRGASLRDPLDSLPRSGGLEEARRGCPKAGEDVTSPIDGERIGEAEALACQEAPGPGTLRIGEPVALDPGRDIPPGDHFAQSHGGRSLGLGRHDGLHPQGALRKGDVGPQRHGRVAQHPSLNEQRFFAGHSWADRLHNGRHFVEPDEDSGFERDQGVLAAGRSKVDDAAFGGGHDRHSTCGALDHPVALLRVDAGPA